MQDPVYDVRWREAIVAVVGINPGRKIDRRCWRRRRAGISDVDRRGDIFRQCYRRSRGRASWYRRCWDWIRAYRDVRRCRSLCCCIRGKIQIRLGKHDDRCRWVSSGVTRRVTQCLLHGFDGRWARASISSKICHDWRPLLPTVIILHC